MRSPSPFLCAVGLVLIACGGEATDLPPALGPTTPPIAQAGASNLSPVGPTTIAGTPNGTAILQVRATRANGASAYGVTILFQIQAGGGAMKLASTTTDSDGIASAEWTFGPEAAVNLATATGGFTTSPVSFTASTFPAAGQSAP